MAHIRNTKTLNPKPTSSSFAYHFYEAPELYLFGASSTEVVTDVPGPRRRRVVD